MTDGIFHDTFTVERHIAASPQRVFAAFADATEKAKWFGAHSDDYKVTTRQFDVRDGGSERVQGKYKEADTTDFRATYFEVKAPERLIYTYEMLHNERRLSFSLATVEVFPDGDGARLKITEQGAYYVREDAPMRRHGTELLADLVKLSVEKTAAAA